MIKLEPKHIEHFTANFNGITFTPTSFMAEARAIAKKLNMKYDREFVRWASEVDITEQFNELLLLGEFEEVFEGIIISDTQKISSSYVLFEDGKSPAYKSSPFKFVKKDALKTLTEYVRGLIGDKIDYTIKIDNIEISKSSTTAQFIYKPNCYPMGLELTLWRVIEDKIDWDRFTVTEFETEIERICEEIKTKVTVK